jgi:predicted dehydrogenase
LDAAIALFGYPLEWRKYTGKFRPKTQVDDYAHIHLVYPKGVQLFITMSMLVVQPQSAFVLNGTKGTFIKQRTDIQEQQLLAGMCPGNPLFGIEDADKYGVLTTIDENGERHQEKIKSLRSSYMNLFEDVYGTIVEGSPYPISGEDILRQLEILEG